MSQVGHLAGHDDVVDVIGLRHAVCAQRPVHHYAGKAAADRGDTDAGAGALILMHHHGDMWPGFDGGGDQVAQEGLAGIFAGTGRALQDHRARSEEHTSELQSLMRISYAVFCWKKKNSYKNTHPNSV